ncbi:TIGR03960 family B12-binding radical SAM protein [Acidaminobacterium chupaoyuni]
MDYKLKQCLDNVRKPARYTGGEYNSILKDPAAVDCRFALCFPELYEIAMSHLGSKILYGRLNAMENVWCERMYAPAADMEAEMRRVGLPLYGLESKDPASKFDIFGFSLQYELNYTTVLNMLDLAGIPKFSSERTELTPLVIAGGPCVYNVEPVVDFFDIIMVGEGEENLPALTELYIRAKKEGMDKQSFLKKAAKIEGVYVPSFYHVAYHEDGTIASVTPDEGIPAVVKKAVVKDLDAAYYPDRFIVPSTDIVFDRAMVELFRGCRRGCRFCQAGYTYRPIRAKSAKTLEAQAKKLAETTGYDEVSLSSLSSSDYPELESLCDGLISYCEPRHINLALPSLRADNFNLDLMENIQKVRKSGLTFAPEAGTQRLRDVINKNLYEEDLLNACAIAFAAGYNNVKLYFMMGLPTETDEDLAGIAAIVRDVIYTFRKNGKNKARGIKINVGVSTFVPKAQTPFQWVGQATREEVRRKQEILKEQLKIKNVSFNLHKSDSSFLEAVFARGDRRLSAVIYEAWKNGCNLDAWDENFKFDVWMQAFEHCGLDPEFYAYRSQPADEIFPWDHIFSGVDKSYLRGEYEEALKGIATPDCAHGCRNCGALKLSGGKRCDV